MTSRALFAEIAPVTRGSRVLIEFLKGWEGPCSLRPYKDQGGRWTIGWGHLMLPDESHKKLTQQQADQLLANDVAYAAGRVSDLTSGLLTQQQFDALLSFAFNVGSKALAGSTLLRMVNAGQHALAAEEFKRWNKVRVDGKLQVSKGLTKRRAAEKAIFVSGNYGGRP